MLTKEAAGPLRCEHVFRSFLALQSPELNASHKAKIFVWRFPNFFRWMCRNFPSETSLIWSEVRRASRWNKLIIQWKLRLSSCAAIQSKVPAFYVVVHPDRLHEDTPWWQWPCSARDPGSAYVLQEVLELLWLWNFLQQKILAVSK